MKKFLAVLLAAVMLFAFAGCTGAEADYDYITGKGELIVGVTYFAPMNYFDDNNELVGFETEFATAVCEELGITAKFQEINWTAKETELAAKNIDCIWNGMTITEERAETMSISTPYMSNKQVLIVKSENADKYADSAALEGISIVAEKESAGEEVATTDELFAASNYTAVDTMAKAILEVSSGTADACVIDYITALGSIGEGTDYEDLVVVEGYSFAEEQYGIAFRKGSDMTEKVNEAIQKVADSGKLNEIAEKYNLQEQILIK